MKFIKKEIKGLKFYCRPETSDQKTIEEVVGKDVYQKKGVQIAEGDIWLDLGGNIGAFAVLALSKGAKVIVYEPDPMSYRVMVENIKLNGFEAQTHNLAVVHNQQKEAFLNISKTGQFWRNSLIKPWGGGAVPVKCVNFLDVLRDASEEYVRRVNIKMDIEGSEMPIIEMPFDASPVKNLVFEWSFDVDTSLVRYNKAIEKLKQQFNEVKHSSYKGDLWQPSWFPACTNVFCFDGHIVHN